MSLNAGTVSGNDDLGRSYSILGNVTRKHSAISNPIPSFRMEIFYKFEPGGLPAIEADTESSVIVGNPTDN
jgi:hypothetical protein